MRELKLGKATRVLAVTVLCWTVSGLAVAASPELNVFWAQKLTDPAGRVHAMSDYRGKVLVINFWASWCPPCIREMPAFSKLQDDYRHKNVQFLGLAVDTPDNVQRFVRQRPVSYPLLMGGTHIGELSRELGNRSMGLPFTVLVDAQGRIRQYKLGGISESEMEGLLKLALQPK